MTEATRITVDTNGDVGVERADDTGRHWPPLNYADWRDTAATLHLWTQIVGKVRLALSPWLNHGWHVPLYVNSRGLGTSPIHAGRRVFEIDFDLVDHRLVIRTPDVRRRARQPVDRILHHAGHRIVVFGGGQKQPVRGGNAIL